MNSKSKYDIIREALAEGADIIGCQALPDSPGEFRNHDWDDDDIVDAEKLSEILFGSTLESAAKFVGVKVAGDLSAMLHTLEVPLRFVKCQFDSVSLHSVELDYVVFEDCLFTGHVGITASSLAALFIYGCKAEQAFSFVMSSASSAFLVDNSYLAKLKSAHNHTSASPYGLTLSQSRLTGLQIRGGTIEGVYAESITIETDTLLTCTLANPPTDRALSLISGELGGDLILGAAFKCDGVVNISRAKIAGQVSVAGSIKSPHKIAFRAVSTSIAGDVRFTDTATTRGAVDLESAAIAGDVRCAATINGGGPVGFGLVSAQVDGSVHFDDGCSIVGMAMLFRANISGGVSVDGANLRSSERAAPIMPAVEASFARIGSMLQVEKSQILGGFDLSSLVCDGQIVVDQCHIRRYGFRAIDLTDAKVSAGIQVSDSSVHGSLSGERLRSDGVVSVVRTSISNGQGESINLAEARVGGFRLGGQASYRGPMMLMSMSVGGSLELSSIQSRGKRVDVDVSLARIDRSCVVHSCELRSLSLDGAKADVLSLSNTTVGREESNSVPTLILAGVETTTLIFRHMRHVSCITLAGARTVRLVDDWSSWQACKKYILSDFEYNSLVGTNLHVGESTWSDQKRLEWVSNDSANQIVSYRNLASLHRRSGHSDLSNKVMYKGRVATTSKAGRAWSVVGYGYRPWRVGYVLLLTLAVLAVWTYSGAVQGDVVRTVATDSPANCRTYPCFDALTYSVDVLMPIVDLQQDRWWRIDSSSNRPLAVAVRVARLLGWLSVSLIALSFSGLVRRE